MTKPLDGYGGSASNVKCWRIGSLSLRVRTSSSTVFALAKALCTVPSSNQIFVSVSPFCHCSDWRANHYYTERAFGYHDEDEDGDSDQDLEFESDEVEELDLGIESEDQDEEVSVIAPA